ncbi:MAG: S41 family peptidase [Brumimicrobium sp.]|nr:S41 family peptidase [Brumimicrobium sp.]
MLATIQKFHFKPNQVDSNFCELFLSILLKKSDAYGLFLVKEDVEQLKLAAYGIIDENGSGNCTFFDSFSALMKQRIENSRILLEGMSNQNLILPEKDSLIIDQGKYFASQNEIGLRWKKWIQYLTLKAIDGRELSTTEVDSLYHLVLSRETCRIGSYYVNNDLETKLSELYLTSLANTFDPHTTFFSKNVKENFFGGLSDESLSFGFDLSRNELGQLVVASIIPGGAAWLSNKINEGAVLNAVISATEIKDFRCIGYEEALGFLNDSKLQSAKFVFEMEAGEMDTVGLSKTLLSVQENIVQSFILNDSLSKIGYIYLPSFYTSQNEFGVSTNGCSADISRELLRLKNEGIEGLIIDLRGNGGGHMPEAINLIGIFIDYGTLGVIHSGKEKPILIKDMNRGLIYSGPLTVMIDQFSASASEFFAVTLQDYNRAIIVGSTSYGKSTAQTVLPIEAHRYDSPNLIDFEPENFVKLTVNTFYRVNGESYQAKGVVPDIIFPSRFDNFEIGEGSNPTSIIAMPIEKETYFKTPYSIPREQLRILFYSRVSNDPYFDNIKELAKLYSNYWNSSTYLYGLKAENRLRLTYLEQLEKLNSVDFETPYIVQNPSYLAGYSNSFDKEKEINAYAMEEIVNDRGIVEAFLITKNLINLKNK